MAHPSPLDNVAARYAPYIEELHEFFTGRHLQFGTTESISILNIRLSESLSFRDEMASMVRSIVYRESESVSRRTLADLLLSAAGGSEVIDESLEDQRTTLLAFINEALKPAWQSIEEEPSSSDQEFDDVRDSTGPIFAGDVNSSANSAETLSKNFGTDSGVSASRGSGHEMNSALSRALFKGGHRDEEPETRDFDQTPATLVANSTASLPRADLDSNLEGQNSGWREFAPWAAGTLAILVAFSVGLYLGRAPEAPKPEQPFNVAGKADSGAPTLNLGAPRSTTDSALPSAPPNRQGNKDAGAPRSASTPLERSTQLSQLRPPHPAKVPTPKEEVFFVSSGVMTGNLLSAPPPEYPRLASLVHVGGQVILQAVVGRGGTVLATHVLSGNHLLRGAAEKAVRQWCYKPYVANGRPTEVVTVVTLDFRLHR